MILPLNRSNTIAIRLLSGDSNLSPVIDMMNALSFQSSILETV